MRGAIPIAEAVDGEVVTVGGTVEIDGEPLESPLSGEVCVLYEVYDAFDDDRPNDRGAIDFVIRDDGGKARVVTAHLDASLLGQARRQRVQAIEANIHDVSDKLSELKDRATRVQGPAAKKLHAEMRRYKRVATLLCAMKAHARGKVHGAMSAAEQVRFIDRENAALSKDGEGAFAFDIERVEALLTPGQRVLVTGRARWELDSEGGAGYRQAGKVLVLEGEPETPVQVSLEHGEVTRLVARGARAIEPPEPLSEPPPPVVARSAAESTPLGIGIAVAVVALVVALLMWGGGP